MYKLGAKKFLNYLSEELEQPGIRKLAESLKINRGVVTRKLPEDILTEEEVAYLIDTATGTKNRAIIAVLYESGGRLGKLIPYRVKDVNFNSHSCKLTFPKGKTGARAIQLV
ncbi:integrase [Methanosarcina barkeri MS]|uniref:Integrase n=2 Tax=Methanosarcina barkeri TaxID=2208 RepID=A0A0E3QUT2_METBA|nr:tyrosine-type recombinase/integrase [Methanosarcina barkeri]AKB54398.1 integrase [Methanosarcina barkeri MS]